MLRNRFSVLKLYIKRVVAAGVLLSLILMTISYYHRITYTSTFNGLDNYYYYIEKNTIDVACLGSSHVYQGINPVQMWDEYGIAAYDLATGGQAIWFTYAYLEELLKRQSPQLVIIDVFTMIVTDDEEFDKKRVEESLVPLAPSIAKWKVLNSTSADNKLDIFWMFPITHTRYASLKKSDFEVDIEHRGAFLGYSYVASYIDYTDEIFCADAYEDTAPCSVKAEKYLRKCIELCQKKGVPILLTNTPWPCLSADSQKIFNYIQLIADEYGVEFINGCEHYEEMQLDFSTDIAEEGGHLNHSGATKYTRWLVENIIENYNVSAHERDDEKYRLWNIASNKMAATEEILEIKKSTTLSEILDIIRNEKDWTYVLIDNLDAKEIVVVKNKEIVLKTEINYNFDKVVYLDSDLLRVQSDAEGVRVNYNGQDVLYIEKANNKKALFLYNRNLYDNVWNYCFSE